MLIIGDQTHAIDTAPSSMDHRLYFSVASFLISHIQPAHRTT